jgi:hypothetical protein
MGEENDDDGLDPDDIQPGKDSRNRIRREEPEPSGKGKAGPQKNTGTGYKPTQTHGNKPKTKDGTTPDRN